MGRIQGMNSLSKVSVDADEQTNQPDVLTTLSTHKNGFEVLHWEQGRKSLHFNFLDLHGLQAAAARIRVAILRALISSLLASSDRRRNFMRTAGPKDDVSHVIQTLLSFEVLLCQLKS